MLLSAPLCQVQNVPVERTTFFGWVLSQQLTARFNNECFGQTEPFWASEPEMVFAAASQLFYALAAFKQVVFSHGMR